MVRPINNTLTVTNNIKAYILAVRSPNFVNPLVAIGGKLKIVLLKMLNYNDIDCDRC